MKNLPLHFFNYIFVYLFFVFIFFGVTISSCATTNSKPPLQLLGHWHKVKQSDTASSIAKQYDVDSSDIASLNDISPDGKIIDRKEIFIPNNIGKHPGDGSKPPKTNTPSITPDKTEKSLSPAKTNKKCGVANKPCFAWPAQGKLTSKFGPKGNSHHDGIDIVAKKGTTISAADNGIVIYSSNAIKGYGNLVLIKHENKIITIYAHNDKNVAKEGDKVKKGQKIAEMGNTGSAANYHVHFEVRVSERPVDPLLYLPSASTP